MTTLWILHRRAVVIGALAVALIAAALVAAAAFHSSPTRDTGRQAVTRPSGRTSASAAPAPTSLASDAAEWDAKPAVTPAVSSRYPAIAGSMASDPTGFASAFVAELFTRDYSDSRRDELLAWAQYENAPLRSSRYPRGDWTKVLVDSLTDLTWDGATTTPVPAVGPWLALQSEHGRDRISDVVVKVDPQWEQRIAGGYIPADQLTTIRDVTFTLTETTDVAGRHQVHRYAGSLDVQLGTSPHGGYGVAATNNFVLRQVA